MKKLKSITSALIRYNANSRQTAMGDCVLRAISLALDLPYNQVRKEIGKGYEYAFVYKTYLEKEHGIPRNSWVKESDAQNTKEGTYMTLDEFSQMPLHNKGAWLVEVGRPTAKDSSHLVCVLNGNVYDSWDSSDWKVFKYVEVPNVQHNVQSIDIEALAELTETCTREAWIKWAKKFGIYDITNTTTIHVTKSRRSDFALDVWFLAKSIVYEEAGLQVSQEFKFSLTFTPTMGQEAAEALVKKTVPTRIYDRCWVLNDNVKGTIEGYDLVLRSKYKDRILKNLKKGYYRTSQEQRFLNSVPNWVEMFCRAFDINGTNYYDDTRYQLTCYPLPDDPNQDEMVQFYSDYSDELKKEIRLYEENYQRVGVDYSIYDL